MKEYIKSQEELTNFFSKEYYNSINYTDYTERESKYNQTALDLSTFFEMDKSISLLDYGCAVGMLLNGFKNLGFSYIQGYDISEWAIANPINTSLNTTNNYNIIDKRFTYTTILDVLEHMFDPKASKILSDFNTQYLIVRIPVKLKDENDFHLEVSRKDKSHVNCKTKGEWIDFIESQNYQFISSLNLPSIYDSPGCFCGYFKSLK